MRDSLPLAGSTSTEEWITLTPEARNKASDYLKREGREVVRIVFDPNGKLGLELDKLRPGDRTFVQGGVTVAIAGVAADYVRGLSIDYVATGKEGEGGFAFAGKAPAVLDPAIGMKGRQAVTTGTNPDAHGHDHTQTYLQIFVALIVLTVLELGCTFLPLGKVAIILMLMVLAVTKASLVGMYFMHLKFEGRWKHILIVPPCILAVIIIFALMPDVSFADREPAPKSPAEAASEPGGH